MHVIVPWFCTDKWVSGSFWTGACTWLLFAHVHRLSLRSISCASVKVNNHSALMYCVRMIYSCRLISETRKISSELLVDILNLLQPLFVLKGCFLVKRKLENCFIQIKTSLENIGITCNDLCFDIQWWWKRDIALSLSCTYSSGFYWDFYWCDSKWILLWFCINLTVLSSKDETAQTTQRWCRLFIHGFISNSCITVFHSC